MNKYILLEILSISINNNNKVTDFKILERFIFNSYKELKEKIKEKIKESNFLNEPFEYRTSEFFEYIPVLEENQENYYPF